ncbi:Retrovirus-related Pol polyprotein from transposon TNT 1-94 [Rhizoctonia solani]|uniref:Retrovirus-related Pol polyprotein from transposon TNT 1-94 n=1 Tax=Rhizoctonia solani TaxID=456999 RepID=A0A8H8P4F1_9AGAM|nr:Retrovirus-related Pol polyprotein from transposon TNT 1-94 [Rhizoctonia solani]QRW23633.1 Retrovirus-related Pol polyprotein from transposon TNT 1-94 [Rhizoctonia solani]
MTDPSGANAGGAGSLHRIPPLRGANNYNVWRIQMEDVLTDLDLYGHADGSKLKPNSKVEVAITGRKDDEGNRLPDLEVDSDNPLYASWIKADRKALLNIRLRVDGSVLTHIQGCTTAADAWSTLEATFQVKGTVGLIDLRRRFFSHWMTDGEDIEEHIQRMRGWYQQINSISKDSCTEVDWITTLIASLPDSWDTFTQSQLLNQPVVPKPTTVCNNPVMRTGNNSISNSTLQTINALKGNVSTGAQTRSRNPNPTHVSLQQERGGVRIKLPNNVATDLPNAASMHSDSSNIDLDAYTFSTNTSSILSAPTIPSKLAYPLATPPATKLDTYLNLSKSTSTKLDTTLATPGDVEHEWAYAAKLSAPNNHPTVAEALAGPDAEEWQKAMAKEVSTFKKMDTYNLTNLPPGHKAIGNAWVFTLKRNANGTPARYKGQLVAQGFSQQPGIDFDETFAPVLNVNSAYLHAKVNKELYMQQIPYFEDGRMWNKLYNTKLKSLGYSPCLTDACVYKRMVNTEGELCISIIATHVDNSIVITSRNHTESAIAKLLHKFNMQDLGNIHHFLGIAIVQNPIIAGLNNAYPADTPISPMTQLTQYKGTKPKFNYDIAYAVAHLAQFTTCYGPAHVTAVNCVV